MSLRPILNNQLTSSQIKAFVAAWLGWAFDGLDSFLYPLVALPFVKELLGPTGTLKEAIFLAALIQAVFLVGWALGGALFGRIGDSLGRSKTLTITILIYAVFTGLSFFAQAWWHLLIFRFICALGIGGEWAAGSALVAETLPGKFKFFASATLQNGYIFGIIFAALAVGAFKDYSPRYVFLVGVIPAFATLWIRKSVPETEVWEGKRRSSSLPKLRELFSTKVRRATWMCLGLAGISLTSVWALLFFSTQVVVALPEVKILAAADRSAIVRHVTIVYSLWNLLGNYMAGMLAKRFGYRTAFIILFVGSLITYTLGFHSVGTLQSVEFWLSATMFFGSGIFGLFPLYIPMLFPVLMRTTGAGITYNFGRITAAVGTLAGGYFAAHAGGPHLVIYYAGFLYIFGIILAIFAPEPKFDSETPSILAEA